MHYKYSRESLLQFPTMGRSWSTVSQPFKCEDEKHSFLRQICEEKYSEVFFFNKIYFFLIIAILSSKGRCFVHPSTFFLYLISPHLPPLLEHTRCPSAQRQGSPGNGRPHVERHVVTSQSPSWLVWNAFLLRGGTRLRGVLQLRTLIYWWRDLC